MGLGDEDNGSDAEHAFAVMRLTDATETGVRSSSDGIDGDDMFTDISMEAPGAHPPSIDISALLVMHDLAVLAIVSCTAPTLPLPSPVLPIPRVLPPASCKYVLSHNVRLQQGRQARNSPSQPFCLTHIFPCHVHSESAFQCVSSL